MRVRAWDIRILEPRLFVRKLLLLVLFTAAFIPLKYYELDTALFWYIALLLVLHIYFVVVLVWRIPWHQLAQRKRTFLLRLLAVALFVFLLAVLRTGVGFEAFVVFLAVSLAIHTLLLLSLTMVATRRGAAGSPADAPASMRAA